MEDQQKMDEIVGVTRCARCGHRLEEEIECPFCSLFEEAEKKRDFQKWVYFTACLLTSPVSIYFIVKDKRLNVFEKILAASGCSVWFIVYLWRF